MPYRSPDLTRIQPQQAQILQYAGVPVTWRDYVSASAGVNVAGFGSSLYYAERTITALIAPYHAAPESQQAAGMIVSDMFSVTTREKLARQDELRYRGETYRIESDPIQGTLVGTWISVVKRGQTP